MDAEISPTRWDEGPRTDAMCAVWGLIGRARALAKQIETMPELDPETEAWLTQEIAEIDEAICEVREAL